MKKMEKGFTLVELMVVVAIIAILSAVAVPTLGSQIKKAKDAKALAVMGAIRSQLSMVVTDLEGENPTVETFNTVWKGGTGDIVANVDKSIKTKSDGIDPKSQALVVEVTPTAAATTLTEGIKCGQSTSTVKTIDAAATDESKAAEFEYDPSKASTATLEFTAGAGKDAKGKDWNTY